MASKKNKLKIFSLGGLQEIGKNITVFEYANDIIIVDCGVAFPNDDMLGIDLVIPDFTYLVKNKEKIRGIFLTHGHEDHIGSIPYLLREVSAPIFATRLTLGLVENKLKEHGITADSRCVAIGDVVKTCGCFSVEFIGITHSIADSAALAIKTPVGTIIHTGDFKVDYTPIKGSAIDLQRFAELGKAGVQLLLCESTNVEQKGYTTSESAVGAIFEDIFDSSRNQRIMIATFSSNIHRIQQVINCAIRHNRKVCVIGRSMLNTVRVAQELGYLDVAEKIMIEPSQIKNYTDKEIVIITTGSQGEPMSALSRIAASEHKQVEIRPGDKIVISASPIPGNEKTIFKVINDLMRKGADVIYEGLMEVHVSGHAKQEEIKLLHALVKPKFLMPIHGEFRHLKTHKELAISLGMKKEDIFVMNNGEVLELTKDAAKTNGSVTSGHVFVDGLGVGDVGNIVLRDRRHLSQDGLMIIVMSVERESGLVIAGPDIISRGFVYVRESEDLMGEARDVVNKALRRCEERNNLEWTYMKNIVRDALKEFLWQKTKRSPMILPIIMEV
ncbi:MAG: ribonuclease J [Defluviitaleaceae bacterium]|nr:ribonuclease J [Defluviitaleaceae bacterium]